MRILFICKKNETYGFRCKTRKSSGLYNSTRFISEYIRTLPGVDSEIIEVHDNNDIDCAVSMYKPDRVVIEALWVVPEKFIELYLLHPHVEWFIHLHSHMPFLATEGIAIEWIQGYQSVHGLPIQIIANSKESYESILPIMRDADDLIYLENIYGGKSPSKPNLPRLSMTLNIGCFGAIRPMKNQLIQAMAAKVFAQEEGKFLKFHMNTTRVETQGEPVLKNIRSLLGSDLVEHEWMEPDVFLSLLGR